jgi:hypothetical protein
MTDTWDTRWTFKWVSPTAMRVTNSYVSGDFNCFEKTKVRVNVEMYISWAKGIQTENISRESVNSDFLNLVSQANGYPKENIYAAETEISVSKLREMAAAPPREDIKLCH